MRPRSFAYRPIDIQHLRGGAECHASGRNESWDVGLLPGKIQGERQVDDRGALGVEGLTQGGAELVG